ncbi:Metallo-dependent phosphatase [Fistulina hepatica ATCC 64428]|uniref:Metallo-dependent phosphatase n=1 Tax=Fistulina hepatica ATCC 64428 TaxID=1128425 RepID=A0A0D7AMB3_9AGAR|nr:Metallo-dependent phosphatase [Fistulina hepatica ATCC 64428]
MRFLHRFNYLLIALTFTGWLIIVFELSSDSFTPGFIQQIGWQSWDIISLSGTQPQSTTSTTNSNSSNVPPGTDWWDTGDDATQADIGSLPLDKWGPLLPHDTGLSEIAVTHCFVSPRISERFCTPDTTTEQDAIHGKWVRVDRNLNYEASYFSGYLNIYYRRTRRQDVNLITDIQLLPDKQTPESTDDWHKMPVSLRKGIMRSKPLYLWYKLGKTAGNMTPQERGHIITELDVLYGSDRPWYGFEKLEPPTMVGKEGRVEPTWLTYRRGVQTPPKAPPLHFSHDGRFKILQVADLHFSVSPGACRDTSIPSCNHADNLTLGLLDHVLNEEAPDLVVFTGDQLNGQGTSWDPKSVLAKFARGVTDRGIPWAAVFGNHDSEVGATREEQMQMMRALPYGLVEAGPKDVHGVGNYVLHVKSADASKTDLLTLYFLDSGDYAKGFWNWAGIFIPLAYDWIRDSQTNWFLQQSARVNEIERPFHPDTDKDLGDIWRQPDDQVTSQEKRLAKPNALMFFHIPLPENYATPDTDHTTGRRLDVGISGLEMQGNAMGSDSFFEKGVLRAMESQHTGKGAAHEVKAVANGHCHITENCRRVKGVWLCFGGGGSYSGYGKVGFDRRFRIYDVSDYGETIKTYKRTEKDEIVDEMVLAGAGAAPL